MKKHTLTEQQRRNASIVLGAFEEAFPHLPKRKLEELPLEVIVGMSQGLEHFVANAAPDLTKPFCPTPTILPMEGGYRMGICTTKKGIVLVWADDGNEAAVQTFVDKCFARVERRRATLHIIDTVAMGQKA